MPIQPKSAPTATPEQHRKLLRTAAQQIDDGINPIWALGRNSVVGWRSGQGGIDVLTITTALLLELSRTTDQYTCGLRQMSDSAYSEALGIKSVKTTHIPMSEPVGTAPGMIPPSLVNSVVARYAITKTEHRAVGLFDIVGFSKRDSIEQVAQLSSLEYSINIAQKRLRDIGIDLNLARTTTGDGFYVWNRNTGLEADMASYLLAMLALVDNATARERHGPKMTPELRVCFSIGSHYSYYQAEGLNPRGYDYIVGDVTISLARMIDRCMPSQMLIGAFERPGQPETNTIGSIDFVQQSAHLLDRFTGMRLSGGKVRRCACYLTGEEIGPGYYNVLRFEILDKHGFIHQAYNQKMNLVLEPDKPGGAMRNIFLGKQQSELTEFDAKVSHITVQE